MTESNEMLSAENASTYRESLRPQFHFSAKKGWLNDPNGLVYYKSEYHLFFQHNPMGTVWGNMTWGHAVSTDLVHWSELSNAILPDKLGTIYSGSAVQDPQNTLKVPTNKDIPLVAFYTAAGGTSEESKGQPYTQCLAYSLDKGRTWTKHEANPVLPHVAGENRDPKVVWHAPTKRWIMALYIEEEEFALYSSENLTEWTLLQKFTMPGCSECPDFFEMPLRGQTNVRKWVFTAANAKYLVGDFDGVKFTPTGGPLQVEFGESLYAVQTFSDLPPSDRRKIQIGWMIGGQYPDMPFNQQLSFPCELSLVDTAEGPRLYRRPVHEINRLHGKAVHLRSLVLQDAENVVEGLEGDLWDIELDIDVGKSEEVGIRVNGQTVSYRAKDRTLTSGGRTAPLPLRGRMMTLRVLVDRTSVEVFAYEGWISMSSCYLPEDGQHSVSVYAKGGKAKVRSFRVRQMKSAWLEPGK